MAAMGFVQHDVRVFGGVVHAGVELGLLAILERIPEHSVVPHPFAQFDDRRLVGGEIDKGLVPEHVQDIQIVGKPPIHFIRADFR